MIKKRPFRGPDLRKQNRLIVLRHLFNNRCASQSELVQLTGLKAATIHRIFSQLEEEKLIVPVRQEASGCEEDQKLRGRKPQQYSLIASARYAAGIDLTSRYFVLVIVDFSGKIIHKNLVNFPEQITPEELVEKIAHEYQGARKKKRIAAERMLGLGIGIPGRVDTRKGIPLSYPRIHGLKNFPLAERLKQALHTPVLVHNNCSVITMSAYHYDPNVEQQGRLMMILLRFGIGGGFYSDGMEIELGDKTIMEIGHMPIDLDGPKCTCGARGCLDAYLGEDALIASIRQFIDISSIQEIDEYVLEHAGVKSVLEQKATLFYRAVKSLYQVLFPDTILLISRNELVTGFYADVIRREFMKDLMEGNPKVLASQYDPYIYSRGACDLVWNQFLNP